MTGPSANTALPIARLTPAGFLAASDAVVTRRDFLLGAVGMSTLALIMAGLPCESSAAPATAPATRTASAAARGFNWRRFSGTQVRLLAQTHPWTDSIRPQLDDFERLTGITIVEHELPEGDLYQQSSPETANVDVLLSSSNVEGRHQQDTGWYQSLETLVHDPSLTAPDIDLTALIPRTRSVTSAGGSKLVRIPIQGESEITFFHDSSLAPTESATDDTFQQLLQLASNLHDPNAGSSFLYRYSDQLDLPDQLPGMGDIAPIRSGRGSDLPRLYGSPRLANDKQPKDLGWFYQDMLVLTVDNSVIDTGAQIVRPARKDLTGVHQPPAGHADYLYGLSIPSQSRHKEAAWYFIQWATRPTQNLRLLKKTQYAYGNVP